MNRAIGVVLLVSGLLKVLLAFAFADLTPRYDEVEFLEFGHRILSGDAPVLWRAPGYQSFVALGLLLAGGKVIGVRLLQVLLSVATTWFVYRIGRREAGERAALLAATFVAFYPSHVAFSHLLWAETLFLFLIVAAADRLLAARKAGDAGGGAWMGANREIVLAGLLLGASALVRSVGVPLLVVAAAWLLVRRGRVATLSLVAAAAVVIVPWSITASVRAGRFVIVDTNPGWNLWSGNNPYIAPGQQGTWATGLSFQNGLEDAWRARLAERGLPPAFAGARLEGEWRADLVTALQRDGIPNRFGPEADAWYRREALREIRTRPGAALARVPLRIAGLWSPDFFLPRHLLRDWYGSVAPGLAGFLVVLTWIASSVPLVGGPMALVAMGRRRIAPMEPAGSADRIGFRSLVAGWVLVTVALHAVTFGVSRMHQPLVPFLVLAVAIALRGVGPPQWKRVLPVGAAAAAFGLVSLPVVVGEYVTPGPRHVGSARALAVVRHLPLPGAHYATWALAEAEVGAGRPAEARRVLEASADAERPGSLFLRALTAQDAGAAADLARRALEASPDSPLVRALVEATTNASRVP